jgi:ppGpp synthetase/RelA/SpoT-type nucleotidyltranferase
MMRQFELVERVKAYAPDADEDLLNRAYVFGVKAHGNQKRDSGDPYFSHPLEVAGILTDLNLDEATIVTALLHDTIEDTEASYEEIQRQFGKEIADLVNGVTKLSKLELQSEETKQAENFRKFMLAMSHDVRVLLVKLADRLHNMRTLRSIDKEDRRKRIATETMEIYAPLAGRMGMQNFRDELEDLAFEEINPEMRTSVTKRLAEFRKATSAVTERLSQTLKRKLSEYGIQAEVSGREKKPYSIWRKMEEKGLTFDQLSDIFALRLVVNTVEDCYRALGVIHSTWRHVPGRFKDFISLPKTNSYRSLHTEIVGPENQRVELQIRTEEMHQIAERGIAAHWSYKDKLNSGQPLANIDAYESLRSLIESLKVGDTPEEFLEHTRLELFQDQVFCFTPKGQLIALPRGATPIDFAYAVHTDVGDTCVGAKIDGRHVPLSTEERQQRRDHSLAEAGAVRRLGADGCDGQSALCDQAVFEERRETRASADGPRDPREGVPRCGQGIFGEVADICVEEVEVGARRRCLHAARRRSRGCGRCRQGCVPGAQRRVDVRELDELDFAQAEAERDFDRGFGAGAWVSFGAVLSAALWRSHRRRHHAGSRRRRAYDRLRPPYRSAGSTGPLAGPEVVAGCGERGASRAAQSRGQQRSRRTCQYVQLYRATRRKYHEPQNRRARTLGVRYACRRRGSRCEAPCRYRHGVARVAVDQRCRSSTRGKGTDCS